MGNSLQQAQEAAAGYENFSHDDLLIELTKLTRPSQYYEAPDLEQLRKEGATLWASYRQRLARLICAARTPGGDKQLNAVVGAGLVAFIQDIGVGVFGDAIGGHVESAMVGAVAVLLYQEMQSGIDAFCVKHYVADEE